MSSLKLDHFITATNADNIDIYLDEYRRAGFLVAEQTVRHHPGLRNGFVYFGPEYLEFTWVEDEALFEAGADTALFPRVREIRAARRPFAIGVDSDDVDALHDEWAARGYDFAPVHKMAARDSAPDAPPIWSFQFLPPDVPGGTLIFALTYHTRRKDAPRKVSISPNSTYAISGVTFATDDPEKRATSWRNLLVPDAKIESEGGPHAAFHLQIGGHEATWMRPEDYQEQFGLSYKASPHPFGEMAVIHLLAEDLNKAEEMVATPGRSATRIPDKRSGADTLLVPPDERGSFTIAITQRPAKEWLAERVAATGEKLELE